MKHQRVIAVPIHGELIDVTLTPPGAAMGYWLMVTAPKAPATMEESFAWGGKLVAAVSDLTPEDAHGLPTKAMAILISESSEVLIEAYGTEAYEESGSEYLVENGDPFAGLNLREDGTVDLEEMR